MSLRDELKAVNRPKEVIHSYEKVVFRSLRMLEKQLRLDFVI